MGDAVLCNQLENSGGIDLAQADVDPGRRGDGPGKAPAVAMKHRQGPEIDGMLPQVAGKDITDRVEIGATMMGNDALRIAGGPRRIAQRNGVPFVLRRPWGKVGVTLRQGFL